ncbi:MAG: sigma-70 family RNA polymerase sigma factor [Candidatus Limnocylindrales bacterium]
MDRAAENARDQALVTAALGGELEAFNQLVTLYQDYLFSMTVRVVRDPDISEEAVQEAFFSAYRNLERFSGPSFRAWLTRIAINAARDMLRKRKRRPSEPYPEWEDDAWQPPAPASEGPEQVSLAKQQRAAIARCMEGISEDQRAAIVLYDVQGFGYPEIAAITNVSVGTVKSRIHRGRLALRDCLAPLMEPFRG